jgi:polyribonucleotide nucleotidyltransferase
VVSEITRSNGSFDVASVLRLSLMMDAGDASKENPRNPVSPWADQETTTALPDRHPG